MRGFFTFSSVLFYLLIFSVTNFIYGQNKINSKYNVSYNACSNCIYQTGNAVFYDDGGKDQAIGNQFTSTTFETEPGFVLSFYFTDIDLPKGAKINVFSVDETDSAKFIKTFYQLEKIKNITGKKIIVQYIPAENNNNSRGWTAHLDKLIPLNVNPAERVSSPPESDCPYAIPLCQNNTAIALGGQYTDLGQINDDAGSCYSGTGSGGSVWYTFSPQASGPIDFTITPQGSTDYDFVLWDITNGCQSNNRNELACNYSLYTGYTGLNSTLCTESVGSCSSNDCSNQSKGSDCNRFNNRVNVTVGRQYAICVNFYSGSNDGFLLEFKKTGHFSSDYR